MLMGPSVSHEEEMWEPLEPVWAPWGAGVPDGQGSGTPGWSRVRGIAHPVTTGPSGRPAPRLHNWGSMAAVQESLCPSPEAREGGRGWGHRGGPSTRTAALSPASRLLSCTRDILQWLPRASGSHPA